MKIAKADLLPTNANLRDNYHSFAELRAEAAIWCEQVNARPHRETGRPPIDMLAEEQARLRPVPRDPYVAALGETRVVTRSSVISLGGVRYSVPRQLIDQQVFVRLDGPTTHVNRRPMTSSNRASRHDPGAPARSDPAPYTTSLDITERPSPGCQQ